MNIYTLKVLEIRSETSDTRTICFKQPALKKVKYVAGQYLTLVVSINGRKYRRPYSFSSTPVIDSTLNVTVKRVPQGVVSNHLIDMVKPGDLIEVVEPMGDFVYDSKAHFEKEIFLWAAGSGITPLMSIIKEVLKNGSQKINLFYSNPGRNETIFYDKLCQLQAEYPSRLSIKFFFTKHQDPRHAFGRMVSEDVIISAKKSKDLSNTLHYICGPDGLKDTVKTALAELGVDTAAIFSEDFEHTINEIELEGIESRKVSLIKEGTTHSVEVIRGKSILEAALDAQIELSYSCQTGDCLLCKASLIKGEVKMLHAKKESELEKNECLLCCSYPVTSDIELVVI